MMLVMGSAALFFMSGCSKEKKQVPANDTTVVEETTAVREPVKETAPTSDMVAKQADAAAAEKAKAKVQAKAAAKVLQDEKNVFESEKIHFTYNKSVLAPSAQKVLEKKADWLIKHPSYSVRIEGNCDERGSNKYNLTLGADRARSAEKYLVNMGIAANRISTVSYGEEKPADPSHNEKAWSQNRRDEFKLIK